MIASYANDRTRLNGFVTNYDQTSDFIVCLLLVVNWKYMIKRDCTQPCFLRFITNIKIRIWI